MEVAKFELVSEEEYERAKKEFITANKMSIPFLPYDKLLLPKRGTKKSAGYDFFSPFSDTVDMRTPGPLSKVMIPTMVKIKFYEGCDDYFLAIYIRSSMGMKGIKLSNQVGVIDADYYNNQTNEGNIGVLLENQKHLFERATPFGFGYQIKPGDKICQGVIQKYFTAEEAEATDERTGGFGSSGN